ncbi:MAG: hypothetical protein M9924_01820 [Rhizobiaceae bacterium]|nr:hypothetical protein [Rhizobiaceae bacterium]
MGMVLSFVPKSSASGDRPARSGELAPVILFPGVRYERIEAREQTGPQGPGAVQKPAH